MKNYISKKLEKSVKENAHDYMARRQAANFQRFMQEKAGVFQVTEGKDQAMFWAFQ